MSDGGHGLWSETGKRDEEVVSNWDLYCTLLVVSEVGLHRILHPHCFFEPIGHVRQYSETPFILRLVSPSEPCALLESSDIWQISSIWEAFRQRAHSQQGDCIGDRGAKSRCHTPVTLEGFPWIVPINILDLVGSGRTVGHLFGLEQLLLEIVTLLGSWACTGCGAMVTRDTASQLAMKLASVEKGIAVCVVPRAPDDPCLEQLSSFFGVTRVLVGDRLIRSDDRGVVKKDGSGSEGVVVASLSVPVDIREGVQWLRDIRTRYPGRLDIGIVTTEGTGFQRLGAYGESIRCLRCGDISLSPTLRELSRAVTRDGQTRSSLQRNFFLGRQSLNELLAGNLRTVAQAIIGIARETGLEGIDTVFLERIVQSKERIAEAMVASRLSSLCPADVLDLAVARIQCRGLSGLQVVVNQLSPEDVGEWWKRNEENYAARSATRLIFLTHTDEGRASLVTECSIQNAFRAGEAIAPESQWGVPDGWTTICSGLIAKIRLDLRSHQDPSELSKRVEGLVRASGDRGAVIKLSPFEIAEQKGQVGEVSGVFHHLAELGARLPIARAQGISTRQISEGFQGCRALPAFFGLSTQELRAIPLEQLVLRVPRVGYAHELLRAIIAAGGGGVSLSEDVSMHPAGLRTIYGLCGKLPLKKRCLVIARVRWLLSKSQEDVIDGMLREELLRTGSCPTIVWLDR